MKPYTTDKNIGKPKFKKKKFNKANGATSKTQSSVLEAKNANRSRKKAARQKGKKDIRGLFDHTMTCSFTDTVAVDRMIVWNDME